MRGSRLSSQISFWAKVSSGRGHAIAPIPFAENGDLALEVQRNVEVGRRMRQRAQRDQVNAGRRHGRQLLRISSDVARRLDDDVGRLLADQRDVRYEAGRASCCPAESRRRRRSMASRHLRLVCRTRPRCFSRCEACARARSIASVRPASGGDMVILDQDAVVQPGAMIAARRPCAPRTSPARAAPASSCAYRRCCARVPATAATQRAARWRCRRAVPGS